MLSYAPIALSTYTRLDHLRKTVASLQKNDISSKSSLYVFSDAPQSGAEQKVEGVRNYLKTVNGFGSVTIVEREKNNRIKNNRGGMKQLLDSYGKMIFLEEDIVVAPGFLQFMNSALEFYQNNEQVLSVSGYCPPMNIPSNYLFDTFLLPRFNAWGFATWKSKFDPFDFSTAGFKEKKQDKTFVKKLSAGGEDIYSMVEADCNGLIDALDVRVMFHQTLADKYTVYPRHSLVQNIGHDGTGIHCGKSTKFHIESFWQKKSNFIFLKDVKVNKEILKANQLFRKKNKKRIGSIDFVRRIAVYAGLRKLKDLFTRK